MPLSGWLVRPGLSPNLCHLWGWFWLGLSGCTLPGQSSLLPARRAVAPAVHSWAQRRGLWSFPPRLLLGVLQMLTALSPWAPVSVPKFKKTTFVGLASPSLCGVEKSTYAGSWPPRGASRSIASHVWKRLFLIFCSFPRCFWWEGKSHTSYSNIAYRSLWLIFNERYECLVD